MERGIEQRDVSPALVRDYQRALGVTVVGTGSPAVPSGRAVAVNGHGHGDALNQGEGGRALEVAPLVVHPARTNGATVHLVIAPGSALVVVPADHPVLVALVTGE